MPFLETPLTICHVVNVRLVPTLAVGFDDLKKRADAQQSQIDGQLAAVRVRCTHLTSRCSCSRCYPRLLASGA